MHRAILAAASLAPTMLAVAHSVSARSTATEPRPADLADTDRFEPARQQRDAVLDMTTSFAFVRLAGDGRMRMEAVAIDTRGAAIAPSVRGGPGSTERWSVRSARRTGAATFCLPSPAGVEPAAGAARAAAEVPDARCHAYERDARTGDLALRIGSDRLRLRRVAR